MNKVTKFLLIVVCVLIVIYIFISGYEKRSSSMIDLIGNKIGGGELSVSDYYSLSQCVETYKDFILKNEYENAYKMLNNNYKDFVSYEKYKEEILRKDYSKLRVKDIKAITPSTFKIITDISGDSEIFTVVIGNTELKSFLLFPDSFLDYKKINKKVNKNNIECVLKYYVVSIDKCDFNFQFSNNTNNDLKISSVILYTNLNDKIEETLEYVVQSKERKSVTISCNSDYTFPKRLVLRFDDLSEIEFLF